MKLIRIQTRIWGNQCSFFKTSHSIPDCLGIVFHTPEGTIVHTGDFKFDLTPVNNQYADIHKMAEIGKKGVLVLLSESTNAERPGFSPSERMVGEHIEDAFMKANRKVFISTFASNVNRVQQVVDAAKKQIENLLARSKYGECGCCCHGTWIFKRSGGMMIDAQ